MRRTLLTLTLGFATLAATAVATSVLSQPGPALHAQDVHAKDVHAKPVSRPSDDEVRRAMRELVRYEGGEYELDLGPATPANAEKTLFAHTLRYPSPYESAFPKRNDTVKGRLFSTKDPEDAAVIVLGGWRFDPLTPNLARLVAESGIQALYIELPFQAGRTPSGKRPGQVTLSSDMDQNEATFVQAALDVERARDWLIRTRKVDPERIGIMGTSLGGFVAANLYGIQGHFRCGVIHLAGGDVAGVIFNGNRLTRNVVAGFQARGIGESVVRERMRGMTPTLWAEAGHEDRLLFVAAERDTVVPLQTVHDLAKAWGGAEVQVLGGQPHIAPDAVKANVPNVRAYLERVLLETSDGKATTPSGAAPGAAPATSPPK